MCIKIYFVSPILVDFPYICTSIDIDIIIVIVRNYSQMYHLTSTSSF